MSAVAEALCTQDELAALIREQQRDDSYFIDRPPHVVSLDAPAPGFDGSVHDLIGCDDVGDVVIFLKPAGGVLIAPGTTPHGTFGGYTNHRCRCTRCRKANAEHRAAYRARLRQAA